MNTNTDAPVKTFIAGAAVADRRRVKLSAANTVVHAGAGEDSIGVSVNAGATGEGVAIKLWNADGTFLVEAAGTFAAGTDLYGAADGKVDDVVAGQKQAVANEACTAAAQLIEVLPATAPGNVTSSVLADPAAVTATTPAALTATTPAALTATTPAALTATTPAVLTAANPAAVTTVNPSWGNTTSADQASNLATFGGQVVADIIAIRAEVVKLVTDIAAMRTPIAANVVDVAAMRTPIAATVVDVAAMRTPIAANVVDVAAMRTPIAATVVDVAALHASQVSDLAILEANGLRTKS